jgi:hypothetical protein
MVSAQVCQPLAMMPPKGVCAAAGGIDVEGLRVEVAGKGDDLVFGHGARAEVKRRAGDQILEVELVCLVHLLVPLLFCYTQCLKSYCRASPRGCMKQLNLFSMPAPVKTTYDPNMTVNRLDTPPTAPCMTGIVLCSPFHRTWCAII